jgi:ribonuclease VapC
MSQFVLDASAVLALLSREKGWEQVEQAVTRGAAISTVNIAEIVSKLSDAGGMPETAIGQALDLLGLEIVNFNQTLAHQTGMLRSLWVCHSEIVPVLLWLEFAMFLHLQQIEYGRNSR